MSRSHPYLAAMLALFMFALAGFPPTAGFFGKFYLFSAAVEKGLISLAVIGVMNSFVSVYYYLPRDQGFYFDSFDERPIPGRGQFCHTGGAGGDRAWDAWARLFPRMRSSR